MQTIKAQYNKCNGKVYGRCSGGHVSGMWVWGCVCIGEGVMEEMTFELSVAGAWSLRGLLSYLCVSLALLVLLLV